MKWNNKFIRFAFVSGQHTTFIFSYSYSYIARPGLSSILNSGGDSLSSKTMADNNTPLIARWVSCLREWITAQQCDEHTIHMWVSGKRGSAVVVQVSRLSTEISAISTFHFSPPSSWFSDIWLAKKRKTAKVHSPTRVIELGSSVMGGRAIVVES